MEEKEGQDLIRELDTLHVGFVHKNGDLSFEEIVLVKRVFEHIKKNIKK